MAPYYPNDLLAGRPVRPPYPGQGRARRRALEATTGRLPDSRRAAMTDPFAVKPAAGGSDMPPVSALQGPGVQNRLLRALPAEAFNLVRPLFEEVALVAGERIVVANESIGYAYFPESGLVSVLIDAAGRNLIDTHLVGREGMVSTALVLGVECAPLDVQVRAGGTALRIGAGTLRRLMAQSGTLHEILMRYVQVVMLWTGQMALAGYCRRFEERLALWLLLAGDRLDGEDIVMTHEALAQALGTHRPAVTVALRNLENANAIATGRGRISIRDRSHLVAAAGESYGIAEAEYRRLIGPFA